MKRLKGEYYKLGPWKRRILTFLVSVGLTIGLLIFVPTGYYVTAPLAAIDTATLVSVDGGTLRRGNQFMLVVVAQPAGLGWYLYGQLDDRVSLERPKEFLGNIPDYDQYLLVSQQMMTDSQRTAKAVALKQLGYGRGVEPIGVVIVELQPDAAAQGALQPGDVVLEIGGEPTPTVQQFVAAVAKVKVGDSVQVRLKRQGQEMVRSVPTKASTVAGREGAASFGVFVRQEWFYDDQAVPIEFTAGEISGPSAGLMFTLQIIDQLTPGGIAPGVRVAGTGSVQPDGRVGIIGGMTQKVHTAEAAGAQLIFVPYDNYAEAAKAATTIQVVPVNTVEQALTYLRENVKR